jgi:mgtE-like transporter
MVAGPRTALHTRSGCVCPRKEDATDGRAVMALAPRRRARRLFAYWRTERRTLRQGFVALLVGTLAALVAGVTLGSITHTLEALPGLIILIPAAAGMRGTIFGALGGRLGTSIHAGLFEITLDRSGVLAQNVVTSVVTTLGSSLYLAGLAKLAALAFGLPSISFLDYVTISMVGGVLGSAVVLAFTVLLSVVSYRRGYDLDTVATPLVTAAGDMTTVPTLFLATFLVRSGWLNATVASAAILLTLLALGWAARADLPMARRAMVEMLGVIVLTPLLDILAGTVVETRLERFLALPGLLVVIPPLVSTAGALGGILASRLSSKLHLGTLDPRGRPQGPALQDASLVVAFGLVAFTAVGILAFAFSALSGKAHPGLGVMLGGTLLAGIISLVVTVVVSYYVAVLTARFGLDPDNHSVPVITSVMDLAGVLSYLFVLTVLGVAPHG